SPPLLCRRGEHAADDRIGPDRHSPDRGELNPGEQVEKSLAHQPQAVRMQRDLLAVEVVSGLAAGCEREVTKLEGAFTKQVDQLLTVVHAGSRIPDERPNESGRAIPSALPVSIGRRRAHRWIRTVE